MPGISFAVSILRFHTDAVLALSLEMGQAFRWRRVGDEAVRQGDWGDPPARWHSNGGAWYSGVLGEYLVHLCRVRACYNRDS